MYSACSNLFFVSLCVSNTKQTIKASRIPSRFFAISTPDSFRIGIAISRAFHCAARNVYIYCMIHKYSTYVEPGLTFYSNTPVLFYCMVLLIAADYIPNMSMRNFALFCVLHWYLAHLRRAGWGSECTSVDFVLNNCASYLRAVGPNFLARQRRWLYMTTTYFPTVQQARAKHAIRVAKKTAWAIEPIVRTTLPLNISTFLLSFNV